MSDPPSTSTTVVRKVLFLRSPNGLVSPPSSLPLPWDRSIANFLIPRSPFLFFFSKAFFPFLLFPLFSPGEKKEVNGIFRKTACNNGPPSCYLQTKRTDRTHTVVSHPLFYFLICTVRENDVRAEAKVEKSRELLLIFRDSPNISALLRKVVLLHSEMADVVPTSFCKRVGSFTSSSFSFRFWKRRRIGLLLCTCSSHPPPPVFFAFSPVPEVHHFPGCVFQRKREKNEG